MPKRSPRQRHPHHRPSEHYTVKVDYVDRNGNRRFTTYGVTAPTKKAAAKEARDFAKVEKKAEGQGDIRITRVKAYGG